MLWMGSLNDKGRPSPPLLWSSMLIPMYQHHEAKCVVFLGRLLALAENGYRMYKKICQNSSNQYMPR